MLAYSLKPILELVPEAAEHVKQASLELEFPLDNKSSCIASALEVRYHERVDGKTVDPYMIEKIAMAVKLYQVEGVVSHLGEALIKAAEAKSRNTYLSSRSVEEYLAKQAMFEGEMSGSNDPLKLSVEAESLLKEASDLGIEPSEPVLRYSAREELNKQAAIDSLAARYQYTGDVSFAKIASAIGQMPESGYKVETIKDICQTISQMDKQAGLHAIGFDFYREALLTKEAATSVLRVKLAGQSVPYESIERLGRGNVSRYIGEDVAKEMDGGPQNTKIAMETLPLDLQRVVLNLLKNC